MFRSIGYLDGFNSGDQRKEYKIMIEESQETDRLGENPREIRSERVKRRTGFSVSG
jgi:hypothetical protein